MSEHIIDARGLRKSYGPTLAVDGIDLDVRRGEIHALLGPNGAGKSTAVELLEGFRRRDAGRVEVLGADPARAGREWRARIGVVWQGESDASTLPVRDIVRHYAGLYPAPRGADEVIELVGLEDKATTEPRQLSGGQRRRLDVALGIVGRPELLFLDEPTTGFDPGARRQFWTLIRGLAEDGTSILLTTHYLDEAEALAGRVSVIAGGRIAARGDPRTLAGRDVAAATVAWSHNGQWHERDTHEPTRLVCELAATHDGEIPELTVRRPTLEDVYLRLIDADAAPPADEPTEVVAR